MLLTIKLLFLFLGMYLLIAGHMILALICFAITIGLTFILSVTVFVIGLFAVLALTGCGSFVKTENIYVDNSAVNNYVGNPCSFYLNDKCLFWKDGTVARNPNNPYKGNK